MDITQKKCIYCDSDEGPFDKEHVFSAGMGGKDNDYLLIDIVCKKCNNIFSEFEATLMRRSIVALARIFLQPYGRRNGEPPEIDALETHVIDKQGLIFESDHFGSKIENLAQLSFFDGGVKPVASDPESLADLIEKLAELFIGNKIKLIKKITQKKPHRFEISTYAHFDNEYKFEARQIVSKVPESVIWLGYNGHLDKNKKPIPPRIFRRKKGEILLKTHDSTLIAEILGKTRRSLPELIASRLNTTTSEIKNPLVCITAEAWSNDCNRAIAKIGFNLLVHKIGKEQALNPIFDDIKKSILTGNPEIPFALLPDHTQSNIKSDIFGIVPKDCHCLFLYPLTLSETEVKIMFLAVLYGNIGVWVELARNAPPAILPEPTYYVINYIENKVNTMSTMEYTIKHNPLLKAKMPYPFASPIYS